MKKTMLKLSVIAIYLFSQNIPTAQAASPTSWGYGHFWVKDKELSIVDADKLKLLRLGNPNIETKGNFVNYAFPVLNSNVTAKLIKTEFLQVEYVDIDANPKKIKQIMTCHNSSQGNKSYECHSHLFDNNFEQINECHYKARPQQEHFGLYFVNQSVCEEAKAIYEPYARNPEINPSDDKYDVLRNKILTQKKDCSAGFENLLNNNDTKVVDLDSRLQFFSNPEHADFDFRLGVLKDPKPTKLKSLYENCKSRGHYAEAKLKAGNKKASSEAATK
jgi:hypothetical protein